MATLPARDCECLNEKERNSFESITKYPQPATSLIDFSVRLNEALCSGPNHANLISSLATAKCPQMFWGEGMLVGTGQLGRIYCGEYSIDLPGSLHMNEVKDILTLLGFSLSP